MAEVELPNPDELEERRDKTFSRRVALTTAVYAVMLAIASLGGNNAMKDMLLAQQQSSDQWAFYQARNWHAFEGEIYCEQPNGRVRFDLMAPFVFDIRRAPRDGVLDLCGLPW